MLRKFEWFDCYVKILRKAPEYLHQQWLRVGAQSSFGFKSHSVLKFPFLSLGMERPRGSTETHHRDPACSAHSWPMAISASPTRVALGVCSRSLGEGWYSHSQTGHRPVSTISKASFSNLQFGRTLYHLFFVFFFNVLNAWHALVRVH